MHLVLLSVAAIAGPLQGVSVGDWTQVELDRADQATCTVRPAPAPALSGDVQLVCLRDLGGRAVEQWVELRVRAQADASGDTMAVAARWRTPGELSEAICTLQPYLQVCTLPHADAQALHELEVPHAAPEERTADAEGLAVVSPYRDFNLQGRADAPAPAPVSPAPPPDPFAGPHVASPYAFGGSYPQGGRGNEWCVARPPAAHATHRDLGVLCFENIGGRAAERLFELKAFPGRRTRVIPDENPNTIRIDLVRVTWRPAGEITAALCLLQPTHGICGLRPATLGRLKKRLTAPEGVELVVSGGAVVATDTALGAELSARDTRWAEAEMPRWAPPEENDACDRRWQLEGDGEGPCMIEPAHPSPSAEQIEAAMEVVQRWASAPTSFYEPLETASTDAADQARARLQFLAEQGYSGEQLLFNWKQRYGRRFLMTVWEDPRPVQ